MDFFKTLILSLIFLVLCLIIFSIWMDSRIRKLKYEKSIECRLLDLMKFGKNTDKVFTNLLETIGMIIECNSYALYIIDPKTKSSFTLKSVRQAVQSELNIVPNYIGLAPYKKDSYTMPYSLPVDLMPSNTTEIKEGQVNLVIIPLTKEILVMAGPIKNIPLKKKIMLDKIGSKAGSIVSAIVEMDNSSSMAEESEASDKASKKISGFVTNVSSIIEMVMKMALITLGADGALLLCSRDESINIETMLGISEESKGLLSSSAVLNFLVSIPKDLDSVYLSDFDERFGKIKNCFSNDNIKHVLFYKNGNTVSIFYFLRPNILKGYYLSVLQMMITRISDIISHYDNFRKIAESNMDILKMMANLIDNLKPSTIGYSHLMYRYAMIITKELNLSAEDTQDIALAAFLSNIGVVCLSDDLFSVTRKYSELEFETMKLHSKVGASLVETTTGNSKVANYILYHHERYDGHGYPSGISGEMIPLGSSILAVIQTFLATISSREYRAALPFPLAIEGLKSSAGTQHDPKVVKALTDWFERKQKESAAIDGPLGPCWEMRLSPEEICIDCPAYKGKSRKCWEYPEVKCKGHGNQCDTCFIKSEYISRVKSKAAK